jgi:hypothetical protein
MNKPKPRIDIVNDILEECIIAYPVSSFVISLYKQYQQRGSLSKKQLEGLYSKTAQIENISTSKLATLEALIKKMPTRYKSEVSAPPASFEKDIVVGEMIAAILEKRPQHKTVLLLKIKYGKNEVLTATEIADLKRFVQALK